MVKIPKTTSGYVKEMWQQYKATALWSTNDESEGNPLDQNYTVDQIAGKTQEKMLADCQAFYDANWEILRNPTFGWPADRAGHEFWLNRNGHGSGFWDSESGTEDFRKRLSKSAKSFGEVNLYVSRGRIHQTPL
jgi:hypothetical protein